MPRKPNASFFRKIAIGAVGTEAVTEDLAGHGYELVELERGATKTKIWRDVKRKRVRIPDLVCLKTGLRIESRAKTDTSFQMSHSLDEAERVWDYGMVDDDWVAFPVCVSVADRDWSKGDLEGGLSYFHQRQWEQFEQQGAINYVSVEEFDRVQHATGRRKGAVEASEYSIEWDAVFSTRSGPVRYIQHVPSDEDYKVSIENSDGRAYTWRVDDNLEVLVEEGEHVSENQVFASSVEPVEPSGDEFPMLTSDGLYNRFLDSRERTMRFTGVKLARLRDDDNHLSAIDSLATDQDEDLYVRLEALAYLAEVGGGDVDELFGPFLNSGVNQNALEAVICIGEVGNEEAIEALRCVLHDDNRPYFLRSAAAWALGLNDDERAQEALLAAFADQDLTIREQALEGLISLGGDAVPKLIDGLTSQSDEVAAGCAEALRQYRDLSPAQLRQIVDKLRGNEPSHWSVWLIGNLPKSRSASKIAAAQNDIESEVHYGLSLLWSFSQSWISRRWETHPRPTQSPDM